MVSRNVQKEEDLLLRIKKGKKKVDIRIERLQEKMLQSRLNRYSAHLLCFSFTLYLTFTLYLSCSDRYSVSLLQLGSWPFLQQLSCKTDSVKREPEEI
ncbi:hypothetical protein EUGRSUZ_B03051 [Eucalyptus grandis]|uniref:Uncharacterized protein n=2 Tax=Eucalyptus grandis TaxID=71139 RepID=A0A059D7H7_EUCGR|nr:hypothetical protein EUGRSUZ_B03051 [Eucalyptus grandis]